MSHTYVKPLFYFGIVILSLLLVTTATTTKSYFYDPEFYNLPYFIWKYQEHKPFSTAVYAQDEDEDEDEQKEEDEDSSKDKEDEEEESSKEEDVSDEEALEEVSDELLKITEEKNEIINQSQEITSEEQQIKQELNELLLNGSWVNPNNSSFDNPAEERGAAYAEPFPQPSSAISEQNNTPLNLECNCTTTATTINNNTKKGFIQPSLEPTAPEQQQQTIQQIPITLANIASSKSLGEIKDPAYTEFYTVSNLFDNKTNDVSYWSQYGTSGFNVEFDSVLDDYQVCSAELSGIPNPKGVSYMLDMGVSKNYSGVIDEVTETIQFDKCIKNLNHIVMMFDSAPTKKYISMAELKLFGKKLIDDPQPQPQEPKPDPTIPKPQPAPYKNVTKINISNSQAEINIQNSTVTFKFDPQSAKATNYNVITLPNTEVVN